jgi:hypothetical protein
MSDGELTRRRLIQSTFVLGAAIGAGSILSACSTEGEEEAVPAEGPAIDCTDLSGVSEADIQTRQSLGYVELSTEADKNCLNCVQYTPAEMEGECGTCALIVGPINPEGYCTSWAEIEEA